jgi:hypothetical protein
MTRLCRRPLMLAAAVLLGMAACATSDQSPLETLRLRKRASFDLDCAGEIQVIRLDEKTRGVRGCARQATYVQLCDGPANELMRSCVWVMNNGSRGDLQ